MFYHLAHNSLGLMYNIGFCFAFKLVFDRKLTQICHSCFSSYPASYFERVSFIDTFAHTNHLQRLRTWTVSSVGQGIIMTTYFIMLMTNKKRYTYTCLDSYFFLTAEIQLMQSFEVNIRIFQPRNSDVHRCEAEVNTSLYGWLILMLNEHKCTNCFVIWHCLIFPNFYIKSFHKFTQVRCSKCTENKIISTIAFQVSETVMRWLFSYWTDQILNSKHLTCEIYGLWAIHNGARRRG